MSEREDRLALRGGTPVRSAPLPRWPSADDEDLLDDLRSLLADGPWAMGEQGAPAGHFKLELEQRAAQLCGRAHALCVSSGTTALDLAVEALELPEGGLVVAAAYGHPATVHAAARRHELLLLDVDPVNLCLDPELLAQALAAHEVRCVLMTDFAGQAAGATRIEELCRRAQVPLVEDASHAHGAGAAGRPAGSFGELSCLSLHASKTLPAGEGGLIVTDDEELYARLWRAHDLGRDPGAEPYAYSSPGGNHRIAEVSARLAIHGLGRLDEANRRRHSAALELREATADLAGIDVQPLAEGVDLHARHLLVVRYDHEACAGPSRRRFELALCAEGIPCYGGWPEALTSLPFLRRAGGEHPPVPRAERATGDSLWIDSRLLLEERGPAQVAEALRKVSRLSGSLGGRRAPGRL